MRKVMLLVAWLSMVYTGFAQSARTVTGKVTDDAGKPLAGVTVSAVGMEKNTLSGDDGSFSISVNDKVRSLRFSYVGFADQEVRLGAGNTVSVKLATDSKALSEVVVVGYGTVRKKDLTGSVVSVGGDKVRDLPLQSFDQGLSGRAAGVSITIPNGVVNNPPVIRIRGVNSISLSSFPLVVIDGIPTFSGDVGNGNAANNPLGD
ncbi:MAG TPA: SusC/RagA family TonB-linked outer membrane protein, partial [Chitinophagaceae bacterium]|nr:SusC/RagA family TonB-linked outer membrane protein [Chitinophagaceae bacterium]